jgi:hypothetical protein
VTKVIKDGYCLNDAFDCLLAKCSDTGCHNRKAAEQVLTEFIIEFANALAVIHHGYPFVGVKQLLRPLR